MIRKSKFLKLESNTASSYLFSEQLYPKLFLRKKFYNNQEITTSENFKRLKRVFGLDNGNNILPYLSSNKVSLLKIGKSFSYNNMVLLEEKRIIGMKMFNLSTSFSFSSTQILSSLSLLLKCILNLSSKQDTKFSILILKPQKGGFSCLYNGLLGFLPRSHFNYFNFKYKRNLTFIFRTLSLLHSYFKTKSLFIIKAPIKQIKFNIIYNSISKKISRKQRFKNKIKQIKTIVPIFLSNFDNNK